MKNERITLPEEEIEQVNGGAGVKDYKLGQTDSATGLFSPNGELSEPAETALNREILRSTNFVPGK